MIVTVDQLKLIHYFYFVMGIFGLTNALFMGFGSPFLAIFLALYMVNSSVSWYIAHVARKKMSDYVVVNSLGFFISHTLLTILTVAGTTLIWVSEIITDVYLLSALLMTNYFVFFLAGLWYCLMRLDFVRDLFTIYDSYVFTKSKGFIIKVKDKYQAYFGRSLVTDEEIREYKYGTIKEVDGNLMSAWRNKSKTQYVLECLGRIELSMTSHALERLREKISFLRASAEGQNSIKRAEEQLREKERNMMEYEKAFYRKTGESELL
jgi:hypothetical protein